MKARETSLPEGTFLAEFVGPHDFVDCYAIESSLNVETIAARATRFPVWVRGLLLLRALAVAPFGLKGRSQSSDRFGIFPVVKRANDEILLGFDDRHLDFRISVLSRGKIAYAATWVRPHNLLGRTYLRLILPFHRLIMRDAIARGAGV